MKKFLVTVLVSSLAVSACTGKQITNGKNAAIDCLKTDLGATVEQAGLSLLMTVAVILFNGGTSWQSDLASLGAKFGPEALACAEKTAEALFRTEAGSGSGSGMLSTSETVETPHDRAIRSISGKTFAGVK